MKLFRITEPILPEGVTISSTEWFVYKNDITTPPVFYQETTGNVFEVLITITLDDEFVYYGKAQHNLSDETVIYSDIIAFNKRETASLINEDIYPPLTTVAVGVTGELNVRTESPIFFYGSYDHYATSYVVKNTYGDILYKRMYDIDNLFNLTIDITRMLVHPILMIEVRHEFRDIEHDNWSRTFHVVKKDKTDIYIVNDLLYNFQDTTLLIVKDTIIHLDIEMIIEDLGGNELLKISDVGEQYVVDMNLVLPYSHLRVKIRSIDSDKPVSYQEKVLKVVGFEYMNPLNNMLPYSLPFALGE